MSVVNSTVRLYRRLLTEERLRLTEERLRSARLTMDLEHADALYMDNQKTWLAWQASAYDRVDRIHGEYLRQSSDFEDQIATLKTQHDKALAEAHLKGFWEGSAFELEAREDARIWRELAERLKASLDLQQAGFEARSRRPDAVFERISSLLAENAEKIRQVLAGEKLDQRQRAADDARLAGQTYCRVCREEATNCVCRNERDRG